MIFTWKRQQPVSDLIFPAFFLTFECRKSIDECGGVVKQLEIFKVSSKKN